MNIIFVRHGESEFNAGKEGIDYNADVALTEKGRKQAEILGRRLKKYNISEIYTSNLKRAKQTGEIISKEIKVPIKENLGELNEYSPVHVRSKLKARLNREHSAKIKKLKIFLKKISEDKKKDKTILIVAHGVTNRVITSTMLHIPLNKKIFGFSQENTGINVLRWNDRYKNWNLNSFNDYSHLPVKLRGEDFH